PRVLQRRLVNEDGQVPAWLARTAMRRYELRSRAAALESYGGRIGRKYSEAVAGFVAAIPAALTAGVIEEELEVRHPYLYRPLVEFALQLPPDLCVRPFAGKWVLREAMCGILPEIVRT